MLAGVALGAVAVQGTACPDEVAGLFAIVEIDIGDSDQPPPANSHPGRRPRSRKSGEPLPGPSAASARRSERSPALEGNPPKRVTSCSSGTAWSSSRRGGPQSRSTSKSGKSASNTQKFRSFAVDKAFRNSAADAVMRHTLPQTGRHARACAQRHLAKPRSLATQRA